jgi:hypothetical protein
LIVLHVLVGILIAMTNFIQNFGAYVIYRKTSDLTDLCKDAGLKGLANGDR